ncbi:MAG TPA: helix-turn-helix transcriptional regulator [Candidatus Tectomicrobia bacterium]|nr:helix-turn-helix transcriptional regulator [Candidatus Tectomicrobia bacterium]
MAIAAIIAAHYDEPLSVEHLARTVALSRYELSRRFTQTMGRSMRAYLVECRIERARALLLDGERSITDIAHSIGFGDLPRFDKVFRARVGCSPSAFRAAARHPATAQNY